MALSFAAGFHLHRQAQRSRVLGMLLIGFEADYSVPLKRSPDARQACAEAWGPPGAVSVASVAALCAFDIGTGTGVLLAVLARRGIGRIVATDPPHAARSKEVTSLWRLGVATDQ
ncbi:MAG: hypothetical protein CFE43_04230 [Burkholderiales bacterium PBB3]|nr:MAG: hypothetical protein CFE43_04230 [Burkholderiales bacterium PBB3]